MKSHKHVIMKYMYIYGVYTKVFVKHVEIRDSDVSIEYTNDPSEAMIIKSRDVAISYTRLLNTLTYGNSIRFITDKIGRVCRPNAYLIYLCKSGERIIYRFRDRAEGMLPYLEAFSPRIYPLYGYVGDYDY